jgi:hypothetical protein
MLYEVDFMVELLGVDSFKLIIEESLINKKNIFKFDIK